MSTGRKYTLSYSARLYFFWRPISRHILNNLTKSIARYALREKVPSCTRLIDRQINIELARILMRSGLMGLELSVVNGLDTDEFVAVFADISEHSPWVARMAEKKRPYRTRAAMIDGFEQVIRTAAPDRQLALLLAHPDLAGRAAKAGELTEDSNCEQRGAGLDTLNEEELARFSSLNSKYRERFGFPFIFAVKGADKHDILDAFEHRLGNPVSAELETALAQVGRIFRFRIEDRVRE